MAQEARERIGKTAGSMRAQVRSQAARARETFDSLRHESPWMLGMLGLALGAVLGASLPSTRHEDALMGEVRDEYVQQAKEASAEQLEKAKHVATTASEAAKEEADRQDLLARP
jgi:hypothetical protein